MIDFIPKEMHAYHQWVCWRYEDRQGTKPTKVPYCPHTGQMASVTDPTSWSSFEQAVAGVNQGHYSGIGFVLTDDDPYGFIDLDDADGDQERIAQQNLIYQTFNSYTERSPSKRGLHIIIKGKLPNGRKRSKVEVYSNRRYMTMTGDMYGPVGEINDRQDFFMRLWEEMTGGETPIVNGKNQPQKDSDQVILTRGTQATNGQKFYDLWQGHYQNYYPSQSEADFAMVDMIAYYTKNREQITRMFRLCGLGQRAKAQRQDYMEHMVNKSFDRQLPEIDFVGLMQQGEELAEKPAVATLPEPVSIAKAPSSPTDMPITFPPGLMGDMASFIYHSSPRPVAEVALMGAIGMMAGIAGRAYNIGGTGLNMYLLLLAPTGTGKEALSSGIDKLFASIKTNVPASADFRGPADIASGQALQKYLAKKSACFVAVVGEFGLTMARLSGVRASVSDLALKRVLLDVFNKSGKGQTMQALIYSDKDKNTEPITAPAFTLLGESTPESFYNNLDESMIHDGLLPRFMITAYKGPRPALCEGHKNVVPAPELVHQLETLAANCLRLDQHEIVVDVPADEEAAVLLRQIDTDVTARMNASDQETLKQVWNRVHLKTMRLSALVAVGINPNNPVITKPTVKWAYDVVMRNVSDMIYRFAKGLIGGEQDEAHQAEDLVQTVRMYLKTTPLHLAKYGVNSTMHKERVVGYSYLYKRLAVMASFRKDRYGAANALKKHVQILLDSGDIVELTANQVGERYGKRGRCFAIVNLQRFTE